MRYCVWGVFCVHASLATVLAAFKSSIMHYYVVPSLFFSKNDTMFWVLQGLSFTNNLKH